MTSVYYFSGTGNSYFIAERIAAETSATLRPIASVISQERIESDSDAIGIVFPVYYGSLPNIVHRFAQKLEGIASKHLFAVCTYGGSSGSSFSALKRILRQKGGSLAATYGIHMPQNTFEKRSEKLKVLTPKAESMIRRIAEHVRIKKKGFYATEPLEFLLKPINPIFTRIYHEFMIKAVGGSKDDNRMNLIYRLGDSFCADEKCTGCGICASVCPVHNVIMEQKKPKWLNHCENCLACYNFCPQKAIKTEIIKSGFKYRHPDYKLPLAKMQAKEERLWL